MNTQTFIEQSTPFIEWVLQWKSSLQALSLQALIQDKPEETGIISVDVIKGFCSVGPLASPRINNIVAPITQLFEQAWAAGVRDIALSQDNHPADAVEFGQYAPHCVRGSEEAETVDAFQQLPFFDQLTVIPKNSINAGVSPGFNDWLLARPQVKNWIIVGDCTDLCTHQLAMHVRLTANQMQRADVRVIVPVNAVDTYDLPVQAAQQLGAVPHDAEFLHTIFLYHMMLNGVEIVTEIT